jgi:DNA invertase Pin-like site-specific DNA recombinase
VIIDSLSRLGRSTKDLLELIEWFGNKKITLKSLKENLDTSTPAGKLLVTVLAALAEFERDTIADRVRDGVAATRARGRVGGRPPIDKSKKDTAVLMYKAGNYSIRDICDATGISNATLYRELKKRNIDRLPET